MNNFLHQNNFILTELTHSFMGRVRGELRISTLKNSDTLCNVIYILEKTNTLCIIHIGIKDEENTVTLLQMCKYLIVYILEMYIKRLDKIIISTSTFLIIFF